ncbi:hypothetical protein HHK36_016643 [Tetracentron sinense]|uniref:Uncharacterized protein n=1 Tax=Tetracentron sinense TaxID=13715 RepID=A0A834Z349_TETSI|nr:hypothetical protein HHK36_016643 [Tetracentron sinense]
MITYEQDPVVMWGLDILDGDLLSNNGYCGTLTQHDADFYHGQYVREGHGTERSAVENDEIIAHSLQEELSQLAVAEASGSSHTEEEHLQASILRQDWLSPSIRNYTYGHETSQEETDDMGSPRPCSSPEQNLYNGEECSYSLELIDESSLDGEVGKRLNQMVPVPDLQSLVVAPEVFASMLCILDCGSNSPNWIGIRTLKSAIRFVQHVPRINGEIPSVDEATSDHQRLLHRYCL